MIPTRSATLFLATASLLHAGSPTPADAAPVAAAESWIHPLIDIRGRYEFADIDGKDPSHALTFRERLGFKTMAWHGLSALVEGEFTEVAVDDYHANAGPDAYPYDPANSLIADPRNAEVNQALLQYEGFESIAKVGRQRLIYDNGAFVGNVGWRQNEQTYDAISLSNKSIDKLTLQYAYLNQVNRIYGAEADAPLGTSPLFDNVQDIAASVNLINGSYTGVAGITLGSYIYLMDFRDKPNWNNNTFGLSAKGDLLGTTLYGEIAWQDKAGLDARGQAFYSHFTATRAFGSQTLVVSLEHLSAGLKTPLATVHGINGCADAFVTGRLEGNHHGLMDLSVSYTLPILCGIQWTHILHTMGDDKISTDYGWEYDSVLTKKFNDHFTAIAKFALFESEGNAFVGSSAVPTATRFTTELNYKF